MRRQRWRAAGAALFRVLTVWAASTLTLLVLAALLPDFRLQGDAGDSLTRVALTAAWGAGAFGLLSALVWPVLVRALLLVPALVLALLVFFLNGSLLLIALGLIPDGRGEAAPQTAVVVAAAMSAVASATGGALAVRDDEAYRRRLHRLADRTRRRRRRAGLPGADESTPGLLFLQLDGVGHAVLRSAVDRGLMPTAAGLLERSHRIAPWRTDWSSQTGASQLGILHGSNHDVPAFRWYEKDTGRVVVCNRPGSAALLQRRAVHRTGRRGLLAVDGASRGNLFAGGAREVALVLSVSARRGRATRSRAGYFTYFSDPANAVRTVLSLVAEVFRELGQGLRARIRRERPRVSRGGLYPLIRAFATVVERDVVVAAVIGDLLAGRAAVYADLVGYDEVAHHSGPTGRDTDKVLARLDRSLALLTRVADTAARPYRIVLLSDHGQSPGATFLGTYGLTLRDLVRVGCGLPVSRKARGTRSGAEARAEVLAALHRPVEPEEGERAPDAGGEPVVLASGNLGLITFPELPGRADRDWIRRAHPGLLDTLAGHPGIGFLLVDGEVLVGDRSARLTDTEAARALLAPFGPGALEAVRRTDGFPHVADIMVNSAHDPALGTVHAFEEQIGSHGGLGGAQSRPFLMWPTSLSEPVPEPGEHELVGAEAVHATLARWIAECAALSEPPIPPEGSPAGSPERRNPSFHDPLPADESR
ncbi:phage holin family protein [Streptomyces sp. BI20]|uniref:phage holin family protein n=1 Tax=Streptomyces sp. BI20 TaxID=3403460 RepID=UPI003C76A4DE